ncbi:hypothetical protein F4777DRAFT_223172 [Nemania sp. FL0916]|nr:hypothetical protein F4777DRAFT_223172 [Nemania sp. FL0916]
MAETPASNQQTDRPLIDIQLHAALLEFAPNYMKGQLERLAHECDQRLERELLPQLHAILRKIDRERDTFEERKRHVARDLRDHLDMLRFDATTIDDAVSQLGPVAPRYFAHLPSASSLALPVSLTASSSTASETSNLSNAGSDSQLAISIASTPEPEAGVPCDSGRGKSGACIKTLSLESQLQAQVVAETSAAIRGPKRPKAEPQEERDAAPKRQRITDENDGCRVVHATMKRRVAFPNLKTGECIFRHAKRKGFFVIRCDRCEPGIFTEPPLLYNRALKHFQKHQEVTSSEEELTNESIFENYAFQVDGDEMASKYWIREHVGSMPHTCELYFFVPAGSSKSDIQTEDSKDFLQTHQDIDDDFSPPSPELRGSLHKLQSDREEHMKLRRTRRNVTRPDYAELVANKDPLETFEIEPERPVKTASIARPKVSFKRRLTKPGISATAGPAGSKKPFGYMSEPWPRRSAPR